MPNYVQIKINDDLYKLLAAEAEENSVPMIEVVVRVLAEHYNRPDLGKVPRKPLGRPRRKHLEEPAEQHA